MTASIDSFNFCHDAPPEDFFSAMQSINQLTEQQYQDIFENVFILSNNPDLVGEIDAILAACSDRVDLDVSLLKNILRVLLIICKEAKRNKLTAGQLYSDMMKLKLEASRASKFCQTWNKNHSLAKDVKDLVSSKRLVDIDWKFGVTASSDSLARVGNCYLQLKMVVAKGSQTENILMEMSIPQFYEFMHEMEKAKIELDARS